MHPARLLPLAVLLVATLAHAEGLQGRSSLVGFIETARPISRNAGKQITFSGLDTSTPTIVWPDGYDSKTTRLFDSPALMIIQRVTDAGSMDTACIEKLNARFLVISVGAMATAVKGGVVTVNEYRGTLR